MNNLININDVNNKIICIRNEHVILDSDVAELYGVQTMRINEAVKNNPDKFPEGYIFSLTKEEWLNLKSKNSISSLEETQEQLFEDKDSLRSKISILEKEQDFLKSKISTSNMEKTQKQLLNEQDSLKSKFLISNGWGGKHKLPKAFTEKGLYMLATILKSKQATQTTIAIVETFTRIRELSQAIVELVETPNDEQKQKSVMQKSGEILSDIIKNDLRTTGTETSIEFNLLSMLKVKHSIKRETDN